MVLQLGQLTLLKNIGQIYYPIMRDIYGNMVTGRMVEKENLVFILPVEPDWELLKTRMEMKYRNNKLETIAILGSDGSEWTPERQIDEIRKVPMTEQGRKFLLVEQSFLEYLYKR